ncbi:MAG: 30S ribosomal protein S20 [Aeriscardovia sp.]|nr:30S ribosomal protein S20 [Aeriscardovia sp.]
MANIKQQKKRVLTNEKAHERNVAVKSRLKTAVRKVRECINAGEKEAAAVEYRNCARLLDKAVSKGVIHKNQAADRKSNLALAINKL